MSVVASVQTGTVTTVFGTNPTNVTISSVTLANTIVIASVRGPGTSVLEEPEHGFLKAELTSSTNIAFTQSAPATGVAIRWWAIEFTSGVNVQRGVVTGTGNTTNPLTATITAVDLAKAIAHGTYLKNGGTYSSDDFVRSKFGSTTRVELELQNRGSNDAWEVSWQAAEFTSGAAVQSGTFSFASGATSDTPSITSVDTGAAWLLYDYYSNASSTQTDDNATRGRITSATGLTFDRDGSGPTISGQWFVVEHTDGTTVQHGSQSFTTAQTQIDVTITSVDTAVTSAHGGSQQTNEGKGSYSGDDNKASVWFTLALPAATTLRITREETDSATADIGWFVVEWNDTAASGITVTPSLVTAASSVFTPSVSGSGSTAVAPSLVTAAASVFAPSVTATGAASVSPTLVTISASVFAPTVSATGAATVTPSLVTATGSVFAPSVVGSGTASVAPSLVTASATVFAPSVSVGATFVTPSLVTASVSVLAPSVTGSGAVVVSPALVTATASVFAPTVALGTLFVTPSLVTASASVLAPTVSGSGSATVSPSLVTVTANVFAPTTTAGLQAQPSLVTATATVFTPTVSGSGAAAVSPSLVSAASSILAPTVSGSGSVTVSPSLVTVTASVFAPTVAASVVAAPSLVVVTANILAPSVAATGTAAVAPSLVAVSAAVLAPAVSGVGVAVVSVPLVVLTASVLAPTPSVRPLLGTGQITISDEAAYGIALSDELVGGISIEDGV